ncbi:MAG: ParA family protein [Magnetococcales bacterium]|nr:AAA family ATPase [Magnetococcales bacterium]NGZ27137.1 ParA family protein [Magnetococcales bacterium]
MTAQVICFASAKGGAGKTILTASFGSFLADLKKKVLLIDCDWSTHGLTLLYLEPVKKSIAPMDGTRNKVLK